MAPHATAFRDGMTSSRYHDGVAGGAMTVHRGEYPATRGMTTSPDCTATPVNQS